MSRRPPDVSIGARPRHAPDLVCVYVGNTWVSALADALHELERYGETTPTLMLPAGADPIGSRWPVSSRNVGIYGVLDRERLRRLLAVLLRDGAMIACGIDTAGALHSTVSDDAKVAA